MVAAYEEASRSWIERVKAEVELWFRPGGKAVRKPFRARRVAGWPKGGT